MPWPDSSPGQARDPIPLGPRNGFAAQEYNLARTRATPQEAALTFLWLLLFLVSAVALTAAIVVHLQEPEEGVDPLTEARALLDAGDTERALLTLRDLSHRDVRERHEAVYWSARAYEQQGRRPEAVAAYARLVGDASAPADRRRDARDQLLRLLGAAQAATPPEPGAREVAEARRSAELAGLGLQDGRRLLEVGRVEDARRLFERLVETRVTAEGSDGWLRGRQPALLYLGLAEEALGRTDRAVAAYQRYVTDYVSAAEAEPEAEVRAVVEARLAHLREHPRPDSQALRQELPAIRERLWPLDGPASVPPPIPSRPTLTAAEVSRDLARLDLGHRVGEYVLAEKLGEGGFGEVFRALRPVAIKFARGPEEVARLERFARLQARVDSERVVRPLEVRLDADPPHVVMELVEGATLRDLLARGPLAPEVALPVLRELAQALADAHRAGVAHLDLKPENVLLDPSGRVKLTDFELGALDADQLRLSLSFAGEGPAGTLAYMAPEQRTGGEGDARSDVYTFGVLLFEALAGTLPQPGDRPSEFAVGLSPAVDDLFERCFARQERRYPDAVALLEDLEAAAKTLPRTDLGSLFQGVPPRRAEAVPRALSGHASAAAAPAEEEAPREAERASPAERDPAPEEPAAEEPAEPREALEPERGGAAGARPSLDAFVAGRARLEEAKVEELE